MTEQIGQSLVEKQLVRYRRVDYLPELSQDLHLLTDELAELVDLIHCALVHFVLALDLSYELTPERCTKWSL